MSDVCRPQIAALGLNDKELAILNAEIKKKEDSLTALNKINAKINKESAESKEITNLKNRLDIARAEKPSVEREAMIEDLEDKLQNAIFENKRLKDLHDQHTKVVNDTKDELLGHFQKIADDYAKDNIRTIRRRAFKASITKKPEHLEKVFSIQNTAHKDNIFFQREHDRLEARAYLDQYDNIQAFENPDLDLNNMHDSDVKHFVDYVREFMRQKHLESTAEELYEDDLDHSVSINGDLLREDRDAFIQDVMDFTDNKKMEDKFNAALKNREDAIQGLDTESALGAEAAQPLQPLEDILKDWKVDNERGTQTAIHFNQMHFKSNETLVKFLDKWSRKNVVENYMDYLNNGFLSRNVENRNFGGTLYGITIPKKAFHDGYKETTWDATYKSFKGGVDQSSDLEAKLIKLSSGLKSISVIGKSLVLPLWSIADSGSRIAIEKLENSGTNYFRNVGNTISSMFRGYSDEVKTMGKVSKGIAKGVINREQHETLNKLAEMIKGFGDSHEAHILHDMNTRWENPIMKTIDKFNSRLIYNPMRLADVAQRDGAWEAMTKTIQNYDPEIPTGFTRRIKDIGLKDEDIAAIQKYIKDEDVDRIVISDIKSSPLRKKLHLLRYNSDLSAIPLDVTPVAWVDFNKPIVQKLATFFWNYTLQSTKRMYFAIAKRDGGWGDKMGALAYLAVRTMPANIVVNSLMTYAFTGQNPFSEKNLKETIFSSMFGGTGRLANLAYSIATGNSMQIGQQISNPLSTGLAKTVKASIAAVKLPLADYQDNREREADWKKIWDAILNTVPLGQVAEIGIRRTTGTTAL